MNSNEVFLAVVSTTLLILLLVSGVILTFFVSGQRRIKHQMILAQTKLSFEQELRQVETEVSEQVMGQFGQEIHDNIGQLLTAMHIQIQNQKIDHPDLSDSFKPVEIYLSEVTQHLRLLSRTLNNDYIGHIGLLGAIQMEIERTKNLKRFEIHLQPFPDKSNLNKNQELMVFRIFQEIIQNALRHSLAKNLYVSLDNSNHNFELTIQDDGKGFMLESTLESQKASGLRNIVKRAKLAGLDCSIESSPGKGSLYKLKKIATLE